MGPEGVQGVEQEGVLRLGILYFTIQDLGTDLREEEAMFVTPFLGDVVLAAPVKVDLTYK
jgi:hypothetical protein